LKSNYPKAGGVNKMSESVCDVPLKKVVISNEALPFVARGGRVFPGQVIAHDQGIEDREEVLVVDMKNHPLGTAEVFLGP
jgi:archaeosine-15-forming tRNA-guanine transglycosylase